ncbi:MAG: MoaD/ThiS family protein [Spirosomataceae bacterium]
MKLKILCFGITRDIIGQFEYELELTDGASVADLKVILNDKFPSFKKLTSLRIALNTEYAQDTDMLKPNDEIVLIPPVSGG